MLRRLVIVCSRFSVFATLGVSSPQTSDRGGQIFSPLLVLTGQPADHQQQQLTPQILSVQSLNPALNPWAASPLVSSPVRLSAPVTTTTTTAHAANPDLGKTWPPGHATTAASGTSGTLPLILNVSGRLGSSLIHGNVPAAATTTPFSSSSSGGVPQQLQPATTGLGSMTAIPATVGGMPAMLVRMTDSGHILGFSSVNGQPFLLEPVGSSRGGPLGSSDGGGSTGNLYNYVASAFVPPGAGSSSTQTQPSSAAVVVTSQGSCRGVVSGGSGGKNNHLTTTTATWSQPQKPVISSTRTITTASIGRPSRAEGAADLVTLGPSTLATGMKLEEEEVVDRLLDPSCSPPLERIKIEEDMEISDPLAITIRDEPIDDNRFRRPPATISFSYASKSQCVNLTRKSADNAQICSDLSKTLHSGAFNDVLIYPGGEDRRPVACCSVLLAAISPTLAHVLAAGQRNAHGQFELIVPDLGSGSRGELIRLLERVGKMLEQQHGGGSQATILVMMRAELWAFLGHNTTSTISSQDKEVSTAMPTPLMVSSQPGQPIPVTKAGPHVQRKRTRSPTKRPPAKKRRQVLPVADSAVADRIAARIASSLLESSDSGVASSIVHSRAATGGTTNSVAGSGKTTIIGSNAGTKDNVAAGSTTTALKAGRTADMTAGPIADVTAGRTADMTAGPIADVLGISMGPVGGSATNAEHGWSHRQSMVFFEGNLISAGAADSGIQPSQQPRYRYIISLWYCTSFVLPILKGLSTSLKRSHCISAFWGVKSYRY